MVKKGLCLVEGLGVRKRINRGKVWSIPGRFNGKNQNFPPFFPWLGSGAGYFPPVGVKGSQGKVIPGFRVYWEIVGSKEGSIPGLVKIFHSGAQIWKTWGPG